MTGPRTLADMRRITGRAEHRWRRRYRLHGSWVHPLVVEAMYFMKALHIAWREAGERG